MRKVLVLLAVLVVCAPGCYHAVIETTRPAGTQTIDILWAHSFVYGIVPPNVVNSAAQCPSGVARVVTEHSFLNGLVAVLTFGMYTPLHITVTCASASASLDVPTVKSLAEAQARLRNGETFLIPLRAVGPSME